LGFESPHFEVALFALFQLDDHDFDFFIQPLEFLHFLAGLFLAVVVKAKDRTGLGDAFLSPDAHLHLLDVLLVFHVKAKLSMTEFPTVNLYLFLHFNVPFLEEDAVLGKDLGLLGEEFMEGDVALCEEFLSNDDGLSGVWFWSGLDGFGVLDEQDLEVGVVQFIE
jgi:hypothetical protein